MMKMDVAQVSAIAWFVAMVNAFKCPKYLLCFCHNQRGRMADASCCVVLQYIRCDDGHGILVTINQQFYYGGVQKMSRCRN
jgi:hypothetical protein